MNLKLLIRQKQPHFFLMILLLRGHIRTSFDDGRLRDFVTNVHKLLNGDLEIFIHTWSVFSNGVSWRSMTQNTELVTFEKIHNYFGVEISQCIKQIYIDDDSTIKLLGKTDGKLGRSLLPVIAWKRYWYGKFSLIKNVLAETHTHLTPALNMRFDVFVNSNPISEPFLLDFVSNFSQNLEPDKNLFALSESSYGCDNVYAGTLISMYFLAHHFHMCLDSIMERNKMCEHPEWLVPQENHILFSK